MNTKWILDTSHSEILFKVKHMMISTVSGTFNTFDASLESSDNDFSKMKATFTADINSINTRNNDRDAHLKSEDFFNASEYPTLSFTSDNINKIDEENYEVSGIMTIKDQSHPITLKAINQGVINDPYGNERTGFELSGKIKRDAFGLKWNALTESGGMIVSNDVTINANVEFIKAK